MFSLAITSETVGTQAVTFYNIIDIIAYQS